MSEHSKMSTDLLGRQIAKALVTRAEQLDPAIEARLHSARALALQAAQDAHAPEAVLQATTPLGAPAGQQARRRWGLLLPAAVLLIGFVAIAHSQWLQQTLGLAERDARVLRDDLPPNAYGDPGFNEYLDEKTEDETPPPDEEEAQP